MSPRGALESYLLEIIARARSAQERCSNLLSYDYISESPKELARAISKVCEVLSRAAVSIFSNIDWEEPLQLEQDIWLLRNTDNIIQQVAAHLRYVQGARSDRLPWGIIPSFERLVKQLVPDKQVMLRPKWNYNYSVTLSDFRKSYLTALEEFSDFVPDIDIQSELRSILKNPFHIIAFPALERENILLHTLLGHELGHLFAQRFLSEAKKTEFKELIVAQVELVTEHEMRREGFSEARSGPLIWPEIRRKRIARNVNFALEYWVRALEELLSDIAGAILFGPAALFSTLEMAMQQGFDIPPSPETSFYPPWRMRLREVLRVVGTSTDSGFFPIPDSIFGSADAAERAERVNEKYRFVEDICREKGDSAAISAQPIASIAYSRVEKGIQEGTKFLLEECHLGTKGRRATAKVLYKQMHLLVSRLDHSIPPNALERSINDRSQVSLVEIINSAWLHRASFASPVLGTDGNLNQELPKQRMRSNRLTLKAIELSGLASDFWKDNKVETLPKATTGTGDTSSSGVLSKSEIIVWMEKSKLDERLIVTPLLDPQESISAGSIDVRLGNQFILMKRESFPLLDIADSESGTNQIERYQERLIKPYGEKFILHPRQLVIGSTLEYIQLPPELMCYVIGKSTWGRMGLIIATATKVDPGFRGCITLEIINEGEIPLVLYPGIPIAQLVLHQTSGSSSYQGGYNCAIGPEFPKFGGKRKSWEYWTRFRKR